MRAILIVLSLLLVPAASAIPELVVVTDSEPDQEWTCVREETQESTHGDSSSAYHHEGSSSCTWTGTAYTVAVSDDDATVARAGWEESADRDSEYSRTDSYSWNESGSAWSSAYSSSSAGTDTRAAFLEAGGSRLAAGSFCDSQDEYEATSEWRWAGEGHGQGENSGTGDSECVLGADANGERAGLRSECATQSEGGYVSEHDGYVGRSRSASEWTYQCETAVGAVSYGNDCATQTSGRSASSHGVRGGGETSTTRCHDGVFVRPGDGSFVFVGSRADGYEECAWSSFGESHYWGCSGYASSRSGVGAGDREGGSVWFPLP